MTEEWYDVLKVEYDLECAYPTSLKVQQFIDFQTLLKYSGNQVISLDRIAHAWRLCLLYAKEYKRCWVPGEEPHKHLVGCMGIKDKYWGRKDDRFDKAGYDSPTNESAYQYDTVSYNAQEIGWLAIMECYRNKGLVKKMRARLIEEATGCRRNLYSVIKEANRPLIQSAEKFGFIVRGQPFKADGEADYQVLLTREYEKATKVNDYKPPLKVA